MRREWWHCLAGVRKISEVRGTEMYGESTGAREFYKQLCNSRLFGVIATNSVMANLDGIYR